MAAIEKDENSMGGRLSAELEVGDTVLIRRQGTSKREGPTRFQERVLPGIYIIRRKIGPNTFTVEDLVDKTAVLRFKQPLNSDRLVKLDMPEQELKADQPRRLEMRTKPTDAFSEYRIEKFGIDGRVLLRTESDASWHDLTKCEYRWLA